MKLILNYLGSLDQCDTSFILDAQVKDYVQSLNTHNRRYNLREKLPNTDPNIVKILEAML